MGLPGPAGPPGVPGEDGDKVHILAAERRASDNPVDNPVVQTWSRTFLE